MKQIKLTRVIITLAIISACSKTENSPANTIIGTWTFKSQFNQSFSYPPGSTNSTPVIISNWSTAYDSIKVNFDNNGNYSFSNFRLPTDHGTYTIVKDSLLVIKPDTSGFVKFCYGTLNFYTVSSVPPNISYSNSYFFSDTILFKKQGIDNLIVSTSCITKAAMPVQSDKDTLLLNKTDSYFKKL